MTRAEAEAVNLVLRWILNRPGAWEPRELGEAFLTLRAGAHKALGEGLTRDEVLDGMRRP